MILLRLPSRDQVFSQFVFQFPLSYTYSLQLVADLGEGEEGSQEVGVHPSPLMPYANHQCHQPQYMMSSPLPSLKTACASGRYGAVNG